MQPTNIFLIALMAPTIVSGLPANFRRFSSIPQVSRRGKSHTPRWEGTYLGYRALQQTGGSSTDVVPSSTKLVAIGGASATDLTFAIPDAARIVGLATAEPTTTTNAMLVTSKSALPTPPLYGAASAISAAPNPTLALTFARRDEMSATESARTPQVSTVLSAISAIYAQEQSSIIASIASESSASFAALPTQLRASATQSEDPIATHTHKAEGTVMTPLDGLVFVIVVVVIVIAGIVYFVVRKIKYGYCFKTPSDILITPPPKNKKDGRNDSSETLTEEEEKQKKTEDIFTPLACDVAALRQYRKGESKRAHRTRLESIPYETIHYPSAAKMKKHLKKLEEEKAKKALEGLSSTTDEEDVADSKRMADGASR